MVRRTKSGSLRIFCTVVYETALRSLMKFSQLNEFPKAHFDGHFVVGHRHHGAVNLSGLQGAQS